MTDQLDRWRVEGRVATAVRNMQESLTKLEADGQELASAVAEARELGVPLPILDGLGVSE